MANIICFKKENWNICRDHYIVIDKITNISVEVFENSDNGYTLFIMIFVTSGKTIDLEATFPTKEICYRKVDEILHELKFNKHF